MDSPERIRPADVARITGLSVRKVQEMSAAGRLPGAAKMDGIWTFDESKIRAWIRHQERQVEARGARSFRPAVTGVPRPSGDVSGLPDANIAEAYLLMTRGKRGGATRRGGRS